MDKLKAISETGATINSAVAQTLHLEGGADITTLWRSVMDPSQLELFELALFCEAEMLRAITSEAHFSSCVMGAAMNEALMAMMCLMFEKDVRATDQFFYSTRKLKDINYHEVVSNWKLEQLIKVTEQRNWIPTNIVNEDVIKALSDGYREVIPISHPEFSQDEIEAGAQSFFAAPGSAMLRMAQDLRNSIHSGSWMRRRSTFNADNFVGWCRFATILCGEIRLCLLHHIMEQVGRLASEKFSALESMLNELSPAYLALFESQIQERFGSKEISLSDIRHLVVTMRNAYPRSPEDDASDL